jgi:2-oxo-3-(phosphooxy)propyl 3-oxoalkanoate synthase
MLDLSPTTMLATRPASVPAELVHKLNPAEVLLTGWHRTAPDTFTVNARWPEAHDFYAVRHGLHDPLLLTETIRQMLPLLSHAAYAVPAGHPLLWEYYDYALDLDALSADTLPCEVDLRVTCVEEVRRRDRLTALSLRIEALRAEVAVASAETRFTIQTPAIYQRLRAGHGDALSIRPLPPQPPVPPSRIGRDHTTDVVLSPADRPGRHLLRCDTSHPVLFDHPVDHVPGMLLLEAARQAAQDSLRPRPIVAVAMKNRFFRYVELDAPCWIDTLPLPDDEAGRTRLHITMRQDDVECFSTEVTLEPAPRR